jgi:serine protease
VQPNGNWYQSGAGTHRGWLEGPNDADFDLELYRWSGSAWQKVAEGTSSNSSEYVEYNGNSGYYYWRVRSYSGSGSYDLWLQTP